ncbi:hypothetical protein CcaCcLH18_05717 [Colletotrichum camelliae]|nr:hypothetical protein CcaCcLH18_05717 [Colletotrichum camelliae]
MYVISGGLFTSPACMMHQSTYSLFNTVPWYQMALEAVQTCCGYVPGTVIAMPGIPGGRVCGLWYVMQQNDTCALNTMIYSIGLPLVASMNPSIDGKTLDNCSASIVPGYAYSGLKGSDTYLCGNQVSINSVQLSTSECAPFHIQDLALYTLLDNTKLTFQFLDVGCFANSALVAGCGPSAAWATQNPVSNCVSFCLPAYPYFGVTNGDTRRCGTGVDAAATALDTDANCMIKSQEDDT